MGSLKKIEVYSVKDIETKDGKKFKAYKCVTKAGKLIDLKFTRGCSHIPDHPCYILVKAENVNVQSNLKYPVAWVKEIEDIEEFPAKPEEVF